MYLWDFDSQARQESITLSQAGQGALAEFMNAVVLVDPIEYQRLGFATNDGHEAW